MINIIEFKRALGILPRKSENAVFQCSARENEYEHRDKVEGEEEREEGRLLLQTAKGNNSFPVSSPPSTAVPPSPLGTFTYDVCTEGEGGWLKSRH